MLTITATFNHKKNSVATRPSSAINVSDLTLTDLSLPGSQAVEKEVATPDNCSLHASEVLSRDKAPNLSLCRLLAAHFGAALTLFLATTDSTIVSTSLPTIVSQLAASRTQYSWVGVAYMLTQTAGQPLYGKISDLTGRKFVLYTSMLIFTVGSLLCGVAKSIRWLILARALAGIGGGGIVSSVWTITSEIVPVRKRAHWSQALSVTWASSAIAGPLLGGIFSDKSSSVFNWRWSFYLNLPVCLVAFVVLSISLRGVELGPSSGASWRQLFQTFDFIGLFAFMLGTGLIIVGFSFVADAGWDAPSTLCLILSGLAFLVLGAFYEVRTTRDALFPHVLFNDLSCVVILIVVFLHSFAFTAGTYYITLYFQAVNGLSPFKAGLVSLPYSLGSSLVSMPAAWFIGFWQKRRGDMSGQKWISFTGLAIGTLGFGLLILLDERSPRVLQILFPLISGLGLGLLLHAPYQVFTRTIQSHEIASGTSAFFLVRFTGATVGLSIAGALFNIKLNKSLPPVYQNAGSSIDFTTFHLLEPLALRRKVLRAAAQSVQSVWMICCPCLGAATLASLLMKSIPTSAGDAAFVSAPIKDSEQVTSVPTTVESLQV